MDRHTLSPILFAVDYAFVVDVYILYLLDCFQAVREYRHCPETINVLEPVHIGGVNFSYITISCVGYESGGVEKHLTLLSIIVDRPAPL